MAFNIDLDRGVQSCSDPATGMDVYMYLDTPGVYLSAHGTPVDESLARRAGFEVDKHLKQRHRQLALKAAHDKVLEELAEADGREKVVLLEREGFKIVDLGYDRYQVLSPEDDVLNPKPLSKREAVILLDQLVPVQTEEPEKADEE